MTAHSGPELIIDNFAGGGGASLGLELACGRVDVAINHDPIAVAMHTANHPKTYHYTQNINAVDPVEVCKGRPVGLAWFSPDCTHHSKAAGKRPRSKRIRDLAWVVVHWAQRVRPRIICLENVEEFREWGPLTDEGHPCPKRKGETFDQWLAELQKLGYKVEFRELRACDYGAPTIRKRLFLIARCDGQPIVWPEPTHGPGRLPYRVAAECIDWTIPCPSIFSRSRPLADATMRRIARGLKRYVLESARPFIVPVDHGALVPHLIKFNQNSTGQPLDQPLDTVMAGAPRFGLMAPYFVPRHGERDGQEHRCASVEAPMPTVTPGGEHASLVAAWMVQHNLGATGHPVDHPMSTIVGSGSQQQLATLAILRNNMHGRDVNDPLPTVTAGGGHVAEVRAFLQAYYGTEQDARLDAPLPTVTTKDRFGLIITWALIDIGMRMLSPRELFRAQGFPDSYVVDPIYNGKPLTKTAQVRCCGNSVCPPVAAAIASANYAPLDRIPAWPAPRPKRVPVGQGGLF